MSNPYSQHQGNQQSGNLQGGNQFSDNQRAYSRHRNDRWRTDESVGSRATWRDDNSSRNPNRFGWGEEGGQYGQSRHPSNISGSHFSGRYGEYDTDWQSPSNYDDSPNYNSPSNYSSARHYGDSRNFNDSRSFNDSRNFNDYRKYENDPNPYEGASWNQNPDSYSGQQDFRLGTPSSSDYRQGISHANQGRDWPQSGRARNPSFSDSGQFGYRSSSRDISQPLYGAQNYEQFGDRGFNSARGYESLDRNYPNTNRDWERGDYQAMSEHRPTGAYGLERSHRGKGPKGYVRSDQRIREEICEILSDDFRIDASDISVEVRDGVVLIEGSVPDRLQKHRVEDIADSCSGVKDVNNSLRVSRQAGQSSRQELSGQSLGSPERLGETAGGQNIGGQSTSAHSTGGQSAPGTQGISNQSLTSGGSQDKSTGKVTKQ